MPGGASTYNAPIPVGTGGAAAALLDLFLRLLLLALFEDDDATPLLCTRLPLPVV